MQYVIFSHMHLLLKRVPDLFMNEYKMFFAREKDPQYLKLLKVKIMQQLANELNVKNILDELACVLIVLPCSNCR